MSATAVAQHIDGATEYVIQGKVVRMPVEVRHARNIYASYVVPSATVARLLPRGLSPAELIPGRALLTLGAVEYLDNDLGQYNEVMIVFMVVPGPSRPLIDLARGRAGAYIHRLPVNGSFTCEAGSTIWGYPKTVEQIDISDADGWRTCKLVSNGTHVFTLSIKRGGHSKFKEALLDSYSFRDGVLRKTPFTSSGEGVGFRLLSGVRLALGPHPIADELRSLGLPKRPMMSGSVDHMRARFGAPLII